MSRKFIFTNKDYSPKSIMSTVLGLIDIASLGYIVYLTYKNMQSLLLNVYTNINILHLYFYFLMFSRY